MLVKAVLSLHRALVLVVLAVALTATGFAHRMPVPQDGALAFALANGADASDFCGGTAGGDPAGGLHCLACQTTASADLPSVAGVRIDLALGVHADVIPARQAVTFRTIRDRAHPPQGPPVV